MNATEQARVSAAWLVIVLGVEPVIADMLVAMYGPALRGLRN